MNKKSINGLYQSTTKINDLFKLPSERWANRHNTNWDKFLIKEEDIFW